MGHFCGYFSLTPRGKVLAKVFISIFKLSQNFEERNRVKRNKTVYTNKNILVPTLRNMGHNSVFDKPFE